MSISYTSSPVSCEPENRGRWEPKIKLKKARSIRVYGVSSIGSPTRRVKSQSVDFPMVSPLDAESSDRPRPIEMSDASPNYMKGTSSSHAKESFQSSERILPRKGLTRMSTLKLKRTVTRKLPGGSELKRKLKSSRSIKVGTVKAIRRTSPSDTQPCLPNAGNKSQRVITRRFSFRPARISTKLSTFKSKKTSEEKSPQSPDSSLNKATCSSTSKDCHFSDHIKLPPEGSESEGVLDMKEVCPYTYCSLHGRHHDDLPPLKHFASKRSRLLKTQKSMKMENTKSKQSVTTKKGNKKSQTVHKEDHATKKAHADRSHIEKVNNLAGDSPVRTCDSSACTLTEDGPSSGDDKEKRIFSNNAEVLLGETSHPHIKLWHLIYKHAVLNNRGKGEEKLTSKGEHGETQGQDDIAFIGPETSSHDCYETDQDINSDTENVVELVQRVFDEILLPETEELSSDDHLKNRGITSDSEQEHLEKSGRKCGESNISTSTESSKEEAWLKVHNPSNHEEETTAQKMGNKPNQHMPRNWSNLKKLILLKRFVKALEKVRNLKPSKHRHLSSDANLESEKVNLRYRTEEGKKNAEEWMLDFALQKVISKLAPAQRQRVALLVEAFETIQPFQDTGNSPRSFATQANPVHKLCNSSDHIKEETGQKSDYEYSAQLLLGEASSSQNRLKENADNASDDLMAEQQNPVLLAERSLDFSLSQAVKDISVSGAVDEEWKEKQSLASSYNMGENKSSFDDIYSEEIKDSALCNKAFSMQDDIVSTCEEEASNNVTVNKVPQDLHSDNEIPNGKSESHGREFDTKNLINADGNHLPTSKSLILKGLLRSLGSNFVSSASPSDLLDESMAGADGKESIKEARPDTGTLEGFPALEEYEAPTSTVIKPTQLEKQNHTKLWYLVYEHMASGIAGKYDSKPTVEGADQQDSGNDVGRVRGTNTSIIHESTVMMKKGMHINDHDVADPEVELYRIEAIKLVEEAIDAIVPDIQDWSQDGQSLTGHENSTDSEQTNKAGRVYGEEQKQKEKVVTSGNGVTQEGEEGNKPDKQLSRSWSNLKKVILLRRFIKALEKVRKFNPREPKYLPLESGPEAEKIELRHQDMEERKSVEEWMLDYALRQVVAKLTPARKRKVELLVEAFETVIPTIKN